MLLISALDLQIIWFECSICADIIQSSHFSSFAFSISRDELISDVLLWTPTHGRAKAGRPARTYIQQLCVDTGCCPEDLPEAMNDREKWRERVRDIRATSTTWLWWWWYQFKLILQKFVVSFFLWPDTTYFLRNECACPNRIRFYLKRINK